FGGVFLGKSLKLNGTDINSLIKKLYAKDTTEDIAKKALVYYASSEFTNINEIQGEYEYKEQKLNYEKISGTADLFKFKAIAQSSLDGFINIGSDIIFYPDMVRPPKEEEFWFTISLISQGKYSKLSHSLAFKEGTNLQRIKQIARNFF
ncbi:MAG: hypothetical protein SFT68_00020, partial [Rickettsiaceae bacterium]|nr:hypothetical protein [Rickettsiaceae bacterium]